MCKCVCNCALSVMVGECNGHRTKSTLLKIPLRPHCSAVFYCFAVLSLQFVYLDCAMRLSSS